MGERPPSCPGCKIERKQALITCFQTIVAIIRAVRFPTTVAIIRAVKLTNNKAKNEGLTSEGGVLGEAGRRAIAGE